MSITSTAGKNVSLRELAALVPDGASVTLGGSFLHRGPFAFVRELIRQGRTGLHVIKQSPGYDLDVLCRAGAVAKAYCGIVAMEGNFGLAPWYRRAVERKEIELEENACYSLTSRLRAAAQGVPFQPVAGLHGSDIPALNGWHEIPDPYGSGRSVWVVPALTPDFAVLHAPEISENGDVRVLGTPHWDRIMSRAAKRVLVVAERVVPMESFREHPEKTLVPHFMVEAFAVQPQGAWPGSCHPDYAVDYPAVEHYMSEAESTLQAHLDRAPEVAGSSSRED